MKRLVSSLFIVFEFPFDIFFSVGWWGTWCCWILNARTVASFELNKSLTEIFVFWGIFLMIIFFLYFPSLMGFLLILSGILYLTYRRASYRVQVREKLSIPGTFQDDYVTHLCCSCCAICQEAREANESTLLVLDYCSGERIEMQEIAHDIATGRINSTLQTPTTDEGGTFWNHLIHISQTSKIIVFLGFLSFIIAFIFLFITKREKNLIVLFLTFLQPILILYFVYWRSRRQYATLDMVIKLFAVGFWLTTFQSIVFEEILQTMILILLGPFIATSLYANDDQGTGTDDYVPPAVSTSIDSIGFYSSSKLNKVIKIFHLLSTEYLKSEPDSVSGEYSYGPAAAAGDGMLPLASAEMSEEEGGGEDDDSDDAIRQKMKHHLWVVILVVMAMAFVVAAGVEETMKHFSVRCCRFPAPLTDPHTILVYLMASGRVPQCLPFSCILFLSSLFHPALGFATSENIEYVFGVSSSPIPGTSVFVGELLVLLVRVLMPVHVICSVIQAANLSKVSLFLPPLSLTLSSHLCRFCWVNKGCLYLWYHPLFFVNPPHTLSPFPHSSSDPSPCNSSSWIL
jgi:Cys-rich protein (TIGR01571 family)